MHRLNLEIKKAAACGQAARRNRLSGIRYIPDKWSSTKFLPTSRKIPRRPSNRITEQRFERRRQRLIRGLLKASTRAERRAIQRGRKAGRKLRRQAEALLND
jgi:hypothetical protein